MHPPAHLKPAIFLLAKSYAYALDVGAPPWEFAVELPTLFGAGAELTDLRWLESKGYVLHREETTRPEDVDRRFRTVGPHDWPPRTAVLLTPAGYAALAAAEGLELPLRPRVAPPVARSAAEPPPTMRRGEDSSPPPPAPIPRSAAPEHPPRAAAAAASDESAGPSHANGDACEAELPHWNPHTRELKYRGHVIKRFRVPAASQEQVLDTFQSHGWPSEIVDPLPPEGDASFERRRRAAVCQSLNRNQIADLLRFTCRGGTRIIRWSSLD